MNRTRNTTQRSKKARTSRRVNSITGARSHSVSTLSSVKSAAVHTSFSAAGHSATFDRAMAQSSQSHSKSVGTVSKRSFASSIPSVASPSLSTSSITSSPSLAVSVRPSKASVPAVIRTETRALSTTSLPSSTPAVQLQKQVLSVTSKLKAGDILQSIGAEGVLKSQSATVLRKMISSDVVSGISGIPALLAGGKTRQRRARFSNESSTDDSEGFSGFGAGDASRSIFSSRKTQFSSLGDSLFASDNNNEDYNRDTVRNHDEGSPSSGGSGGGGASAPGLGIFGLVLLMLFDVVGLIQSLFGLLNSGDLVDDDT